MSLPHGLQTLTLCRCTYLSRWEWLSHSKGLRELHLFKSAATGIQLNGLGALNNLSRLIIEGCESLERVQDLSGLGKLKHLGFYECPKLVEIGGLAQLLGSLRHLDIWRCNSIPCLPDPSETEAPRRPRLTVRSCSKLLGDGREDYSGPYEEYIRL
ncbi:hypothetical protein MLD38_009323 [Melastoma candidum]|uniref:Uncharacterized protein n=1 Tax=Melastoma candidum TaxID=119954 RepID=A0ACB9RWL8_9MYRT|nr:hypothetical protein MLD38_009323 [Melastoma candidum]